MAFWRLYHVITSTDYMFLRLLNCIFIHFPAFQAALIRRNTPHNAIVTFIFTILIRMIFLHVLGYMSF